MKNIFTILLLTAVAVLSLQQTVSAISITITSSTNWSVITSGSGTGGQPNSSDQITVSNGAVLTVNITSATCSSITLGGTDGTAGSLGFAASGSPALSVTSSLNLGSGISGGNGTITFQNGSSIICNNLLLNSTSNATINMQGGTLTINGTITVGTGGAYTWRPDQGTVIIAAASTLPASVFSQFNNLTINPGSGNTVSLAQTLDVNNNLTISSGTLDNRSYHINGNTSGTFTMDAGTNLILGDPASSSGVQFPSSFTTAHITLDPTSTVVFKANGSQGVSSVPRYSNLTLSTGAGSSTKTIAGGAATVAGILTISSGTTLDVSTNNWGLNIGGDFINNGTFTQRNGTVTMNGTAAQSIGGSNSTTFNNLTIFNTNAMVSAGKDLTISGNLAVNLNACLDMKTYVLSAGTTSNSGTINTQNTSMLPISTGNTWECIINFNGSGTQHLPQEVYTTLKINNASTFGVLLTGNSVSITNLIIGDAAANSLFNDQGFSIQNATNLTIVSGTYCCGGSAFSWTNISGCGTVWYALCGPQTITGRTYPNLKIANYDGTSSTKTLAGNVTVSGTLNIGSNTTLAFSGSTVQNLVVGTLENWGSLNMSPGNLTHLLQINVGCGSSIGNFIPGSGSKVEYTAAAGLQTIGSGTYNNLQLDNTTGKNTAGGNLIVNGNLSLSSGMLNMAGFSTNLGTTGILSGEGSGHYIIGKLSMDEVIGSSAASARLNTIGVSISSGPDNLGTVEVLRVCGDAGKVTVNSSVGINRKWSVFSSNATVSGRNITLSWVSDDVPAGYSLASAQVWNSTNNGLLWSAVGTAGDLSSNSVTVPFTSSSNPTVWAVSNNTIAQRNALLFGGGQYVVTSATGTFKINRVTIEVWIKPTAPSGSTEEILRLKSSSTDDGCRLRIESTGNVSFKPWSGGFWFGSPTSGINVFDGSWHHLAGVINGTWISLYVDGVQKYVNTLPSNLNYASNVLMYLGVQPGPYNYYNGLMSEVRIWNIARSQSDIQSTMHATLSGFETGLIGYWQLNESGTSTIANELSYNFTGTLNNFTFDGSTNGWVPITDLALPVELTDFSAKVNSGSVLLSWKTATEINNYGFEIERKSPSASAASPFTKGGLDADSWEKIGFVAGAGNSNSPKDYSFIDENPPSGNIQYRLKQIDNDGGFKYFGIVAEVNISLINVKENQIPKEFGVSQNYPNPFNPSTVISYQLPVSSNVTLRVYDALGREVETLVDGNQQAGYYNINFNGSKLASGIYIYRLTAGQFISTKKLMMVK
jgi:hypothetical protein